MIIRAVTSRNASPRRGVVLIMVVAILATLTIAGTAFVMVMGQESKAASSALYLAQAELAARAGLEHAIAVIDESRENLDDGTWLAVTPDGALLADGSFVRDEVVDNGTLDAGWHRCFEVDSGGEQLSNPALWVSHYGGGKFGAEASGQAAVPHAMRGRVFPFPPGIVTKRGEYAVCVVDLDGKLHASAPQWNGGVGSNASGLPSDLAPCVEAVATLAGLSSMAAEALKLESVRTFYSSVSEIPRRAGVSTSAKKYALESVFTPYPIPHHEDIAPLDVSGTPTYTLGSDTSAISLASGALVPDAVIGQAVVFVESGEAYGVIDNTANSLVVRGDCSGEPADARVMIAPRPAVNVNTVPQALLAELIKPVRGFQGDVDAAGPVKAAALAKYLCERRPFAGRHEFEDAVFRVVANDDDTGAIEDLEGNLHLTERQFNDFLNSAASGIDPDQSAFDDPAAPGVYEFDGWEPFGDLIGPAQIGGSRTNGSDVTWSTGLKFRSRFFHVYVIGRGWNENVGEPVGVKRLHAIYDSQEARTVWLRWNLSSRGSLTDVGAP